MSWSLLSNLLSSHVRKLGVALVLGAAVVPALAVPLMSMNLEDLMPMGAEFKKSLNLDANQQTLWQQTENKTKQLMRERLSRREHLQDTAKTALANPKVELRDLVGAVDAETAASAVEEKQLREWWLTVNDALNDAQRQQVAVFIGEQMMRVFDDGSHSVVHDKDSSSTNHSGHHNRGGASTSIPGIPGD